MKSVKYNKKRYLREVDRTEGERDVFIFFKVLHVKSSPFMRNLSLLFLSLIHLKENIKGLNVIS